MGKIKNNYCNDCPHCIHCGRNKWIEEYMCDGGCGKIIDEEVYLDDNEYFCRECLLEKHKVGELFYE